MSDQTPPDTGNEDLSEADRLLKAWAEDMRDDVIRQPHLPIVTKLRVVSEQLRKLGFDDQSEVVSDACEAMLFIAGRACLASSNVLTGTVEKDVQKILEASIIGDLAAIRLCATNGLVGGDS